MGKRHTHHDLLLVDGYNVIYGAERYAGLIDEPSGRRDDHDPFDRAREALVTDVAAYAQGSFDPVIVFDAGGNVAPEHPELRRAGVRMVFSPVGVTADTVIEQMATDARERGRCVTVVTSDATVQATVFGDGVTRVSSRMLAGEFENLDVEREVDIDDRTHAKLTVEDRLDPETRAKLNALLGR